MATATFAGNNLVMKGIWVLLFVCCLLGENLQSQSAPAVQSGPMLGYAEMREAVVWIQLKEEGQVWAAYHAKTAPGDTFYTDSLLSQARDAFTAKLYLRRGMEPGKTYEYTIYVDGIKQNFPYPTELNTAPQWAYRTEPPSFTMALGSCTYINEEAYDRPGKAYGGGYSIFESIAAMKPDAMLWLGDNTYLRPADWWSRNGYLQRYTHTRSLPELQALLAACNHFAIWDDHDFGPNNTSGSWVHKDWALEAFKLFWPNPSYGYEDLPGTMTAFRYRDLDFILMDNRYHRTEEHQGAPEHIWGRKQTDRAIDLLLQSRAPYKFVVTGGQFLNSAQKYENHANYEEERSYFLQRIREEGIEGVVMISGDRHHSEVMEYRFPDGSLMHEFTVSPLTSSAAQPEEENHYRVKGSLLEERNYAILDVQGKRQEREVSIIYYSTEGKELFRYKLPKSK